MNELRWADEIAALDVRLRRVGPTAYVSMSGEADICGWRALNAMTDTLTNDSSAVSEVVFDLTGLTFACVRTMCVLTEVCKRLSSRGVHTSIRGMQPVVARVASLVEADLPGVASISRN